MHITNQIKNLLILIIVAVSNILVIILMSLMFKNFTLGSWTNAIIITVAVGIADILIWPIITKFLMKFMILTFGIGALIINAAIFYSITCFIPGVSAGAVESFVIPLVMAIVTTYFSNIADIDYYDSYTRRIINHVKKEHPKSKSPGLIMLEIDGLSIDVLKEAIEKDMMPTVKSWIEDKSHILKGWETDLSSQTGASQAGILHGNNKNIVAYRWVEKEKNNHVMVSGKLSDAPIIEKRISDGHGLLSDNGVSITNMFTGDSENSVLTSSRFKILTQTYSKLLDVVFLEAYSFQRVFVLFLWEIIIELKSQIIHKAKNIQPRLKKSFVYPAIRAGANVLLREVATETLIGNMSQGEMNIAYASYVGYDEVAHHSGIRDDDVWNVLKQIDLEFKRLQNAEKIVERNYQFVVLSDHGQGNGSTFKQRYGISLADYVRRLLPDDMRLYNKHQYISNHFKDAYIPENKQIGSIIDKVDKIMEKELFLGRVESLNKKLPDLISHDDSERYESDLDYITKHDGREQTTKTAEDSTLIVLGSGNLGLIYLTQWDKRLYYEEIVSLFPNLIPGLVKHEGIGFILVESYTNGPMVIGSEGIYYLDCDRIVGKNPLENFGKNAAAHLKRHNTFEHMPDILVNSFYNPETEEICAYEELIGSHGGLGGSQTRPFILYPSDWDDPGELVGAKSIYDFLKREYKKLSNK